MLKMIFWGEEFKSHNCLFCSFQKVITIFWADVDCNFICYCKSFPLVQTPATFETPEGPKSTPKPGTNAKTPAEKVKSSTAAEELEEDLDAFQDNGKNDT